MRCLKHQNALSCRCMHRRLPRVATSLIGRSLRRQRCEGQSWLAMMLLPNQSAAFPAQMHGRMTAAVSRHSPAVTHTICSGCLDSLASGGENTRRIKHNVVSANAAHACAQGSNQQGTKYIRQAHRKIVAREAEILHAGHVVPADGQLATELVARQVQRPQLRQTRPLQHNTTRTAC
jgi:hypothetical protein